MQANSKGFIKLYRSFVLAMGSLAIAGYLVAYVHADRGAVHYQNYVLAATDCFYAAIDNAELQAACSVIPAVRAPLRAHREAIAVGEPLLNMALALTVAILLAPLMRRAGSKLVDLLLLPGEAVQPAVVHDMIPAVSRARLPGW